MTDQELLLKMYAEWRNRCAEVEQYLLDVSKGKKPMLTMQDCARLALKLGVPEKFRVEHFQ